ncbi:zinc finger (C3HC4-type RING finger) family protein [Actinidia rufa]|uniref:Zinc finger (C3HC4-type RING finger) family protein n=1 Tax=Actinidia rufa TaxID=165716 RepID=A0A7J0HBP5_9ERIC|nr:zinc finger (C3HC4-type RING finger) family protein [Actinidia rufa]
MDSEELQSILAEQSRELAAAKATESDLDLRLQMQEALTASSQSLSSSKQFQLHGYWRVETKRGKYSNLNCSGDFSCEKVFKLQCISCETAALSIALKLAGEAIVFSGLLAGRKYQWQTFEGDLCNLFGRY